MARKKRLNTKFLVLASIPVGLAALALAAYLFIIPTFFPGLWSNIRQLRYGKPEARLELAKSSFDAGNYEQAVEAYRDYLFLKGGNPDAETCTVLGDCFAHLMLKDPVENRRIMEGYWMQALTID